jgi:hypothetical protein
MHSSNGAAVARPLRAVLRTLTVFAVLSSPWVVATAAPSISGSPATSVVAAHYYAFQPSASASAGKALTFSIANKPAWAIFSTLTGRLAGTPLPSNVGKFANVAISASDGTGRASLAPFAITVLPLANNPPKVSGSPAGSVVAGKPYSFQPTATDPNGLKILFGIWNRPSWASFDGATGRLTGTPSAANVGTYSNIVITAYDGYMKAPLPAFSIVVQPVASSPPPPPVVSTTNGSATLSWVPPMGNSNGTVLTNLAGYRIYYGTTPSLAQSVTVANPGLTRYALTGLAANTWYFAMTAYNSAGLESARTAVESTVVK